MAHGISSTTRRELVLATCALLSALFPAIGNAAGEGDATIQIDAFTVLAGQSGDGQAFCPSGTRVVGGGVTSTGAATASRVHVSGPLDETGLTANLNDGDVGRSWYANVVNNAAVQNTYVSTAICSAGSNATIRTDPFTVQPPQAGDGQAFCPSGTRVVGGGVTSTGAATASYVQVSGPLDETGLTGNLNDGDVGRSWYANGFNAGAGQNTYVSTAICSAGSDATIRTDSFTVLAGQSGDGQAFCPSGTRVVGGGVTSTGAARGYVAVSGPLDETGLTANLTNGDLGRSWYASVVNNAAVQNTYVSTALCAPSSTGPGSDGSDTDPPETEITKGAPNKLAKHKAKFRFTSSEPDSTFECKLDKKKFKPCESPKRVKRLDEGKHKFKVRAIDEAGNVDPSPAKDKFKVVE